MLITMLGLLVASLLANDVKQGEFGAARPGAKAGSKKAEADTPSEKKPRSSPATAARRYPYHGTLQSVDAAAQSITLAGKTKQRVILITSETNITRDGKPVSLKEAIAGEKVSGSVVKNREGKEEAITLRLNGKSEQPKS
jgi:hypothetical protein